MLVLPIPMIVAIVLGFLLARAWGQKSQPVVFQVLLLSCVVQSLLVSLTLYYGLRELAYVQPVTAAFVPPLAWLAFQSVAAGRFVARRDLVHLAVPGFTLFCVVFAPVVLDVLIPAIFVGYGIAILLRLRGSGRDLSLARLDAGNLPAQIWAAVAVALILSALSDVLIAVALILGATEVPLLIISVFSSAALLGIGLLSLSPDAAGEAEPEEEEAADVAVTEEDADLMRRLDALLHADRLYLDPALTLARLAHRLHVPVKGLSVAINRVTGGNVSRHINGFRVRHACGLLKEGTGVTSAMLESGFNTKSNFNREFRRVTGESPTAWLAAQAG